MKKNAFKPVEKPSAKSSEAKEKAAKYEKQKNNVRNNREYDSLTKEIEFQSLEIQLCDKRMKEYTEALNKIKAGANNTANWLEDIGGGILYKEGVGYLTITTEPDVGADFVTFYIDDAELDIAERRMGASSLIGGE